MDRRGKALLSILALSLLIGSASLAISQKPLLRAMEWLSPEGQFEALTSEPTISFRLSGDGLTQIDAIMAGEAAFHAPTLLGGQAAKAGISCASCHVNGRGNPHFQFPGISGEPGTADVTHSFFSSHRGDKQFNPVPIPDLSLPGKISRDPATDDLEIFIRGLIVEEFNGREPSAEIIDAIANYIRVIEPRDTPRHSPIEIVTHFDRIDNAFSSAENYLEKGDTESAHLLFSAARHQLGLVHERFSGNRFTKERDLLEQLSLKIGQLQNTLNAAKPVDFDQLNHWSMGYERAKDILADSSDKSLYNSERLAIALQN